MWQIFLEYSGWVVCFVTRQRLWLNHGGPLYTWKKPEFFGENQRSSTGKQAILVNLDRDTKPPSTCGVKTHNLRVDFTVTTGKDLLRPFGHRYPINYISYQTKHQINISVKTIEKVFKYIIYIYIRTKG